MTGIREKQLQKRKQETLDVALRLLLQRGYANLNMDELAVEAGISAATLRRARQDMGVRPRYTGTPGIPGHWLWAMPD